METTDTPPAAAPATRPLALSFPLSDFSVTRSGILVRDWHATGSDRATLTTESVPERILLRLVSPQPQPGHSDDGTAKQVQDEVILDWKPEDLDAILLTSETPPPRTSSVVKLTLRTVALMKLEMTFDLHVTNGFSSHRLEKLENRLEYWARTFQIPRRISEKRAIEIPREGEEPIPRVKTPPGYREGVTSTMMFHIRPRPVSDENDEAPGQKMEVEDRPKKKPNRVGKGRGEGKKKNRDDDDDDDDDYVDGGPAGDSEEGEASSDVEVASQDKAKGKKTSGIARKREAKKSEKGKGKEDEITTKNKKESKDSTTSVHEVGDGVDPGRDGKRARRESTIAKTVSYAEKDAYSFDSTDEGSEEDEEDAESHQSIDLPPKKRKRDSVSRSRSISIPSASTSKAPAQKKRSSSKPSRPVAPPSQRPRERTHSPTTLEDGRRRRARANREYPIEDETSPVLRAVQQALEDVAKRLDAVQPQLDPLSRIVYSPERMRSLPLSSAVEAGEGGGGAVAGPSRTASSIAGGGGAANLEHDYDFLMNHYSDARAIVLVLTRDVKEVKDAVQRARGGLDAFEVSAQNRGDKGKERELTGNAMDLDEPQAPIPFQAENVSDLARRPEALETLISGADGRQTSFQPTLDENATQIAKLQDRIKQLEQEKSDWIRIEEARMRIEQERDRDRRRVEEEREKERTEDRERLTRIEESLKTLAEQSSTSGAGTTPIFLPPLSAPPQSRPDLAARHAAEDVAHPGGGAVSSSSDLLRVPPLLSLGSSSSSIPPASRASARLASAPDTELSRRRADVTGRLPPRPRPRATSMNPASQDLIPQLSVAPSKSNPDSPYGTRGKGRAETTEPPPKVVQTSARSASRRTPTRRDYGPRSMHSRRSAAHELEVLGSSTFDSTPTTGLEPDPARPEAAQVRESTSRSRGSPEPELTGEDESMYEQVIAQVNELGAEGIGRELMAMVRVAQSAREELKRS